MVVRRMTAPVLAAVAGQHASPPVVSSPELGSCAISEAHARIFEHRPGLGTPVAATRPDHRCPGATTRPRGGSTRRSRRARRRGRTSLEFGAGCRGFQRERSA
eukprot:7384556-Prymnesium_polylepis.2